MAGIAICLIIGLIVLVVGAIVSAYNRHLIATGQADYFVKIAASGKGTTYHSLACNRSRGAYMVSLKEAQNAYYAPCASCGGRPSVRRISE